MPEQCTVSSVPMEEKHPRVPSWLTALKRVFGCPHKDAHKLKTPKKCRQYNHNEEEEESNVPVAAKAKVVEIIRLKTPQSRNLLFASIAIQTAFRAHLAKRAVGALKGIVKLQALIRGQNVRRQAQRTLKCMHALFRVQAMMKMMLMRDDDDDTHLRCPPHISHHSARKPIFAAEPHSISHPSRCKISTGAPTHGRNNSVNTLEMEDLKANFRRRLQELRHRQRPISPQKPIGNSVLRAPGTHSPSRSSPAQASPRHSYSAANTPCRCPAANLPTSKRFSLSGAGREPNYMAATESTRARVRSQSAPRPRAEMERRGPPAKKCSCCSVQNRRAGIERQSVCSGNTESAGGEISPCSTPQLRIVSRIPSY